MKILIIYLSIIPWLLYYSVSIFKTLIDLDKYNVFSLFRFDSIILILIFAYFVSFNKSFVIEMLFATMNLYLFINRLYEKNMNHPNLKKIIFNNKLLLLFIYIITFILIFILESYLKLAYFYYTLFALSFFINTFIYLLKKIKIFK
jgi:hypothetical protein